jgi:hypothetical protein
MSEDVNHRTFKVLFLFIIRGKARVKREYIQMGVSIMID